MNYNLNEIGRAPSNSVNDVRNLTVSVNKTVQRQVTRSATTNVCHYTQEDVGFSPTSEIDGGGAQHIGGCSPHPSG
jgi:hypothetical protein